MLACISSLPVSAYDVGSRLLATGGATQLEGSAGGGLVPWAVIAGYGQNEEWGGDVYATYISTDNYDVTAAGINVGINNRIEFSISEQILDISDLAAELSLPDDDLKQVVLGAKLRLFGDLIYGDLPQISAGVQYKKNLDFDVPNLVGAIDDSNVDFYLAGSRLWLSGIKGYPLLLNVTLRLSNANQLGLLGFGGDKENGRDLLFEGSAGILLRRNLMLAYEYRQKPDNLSFASEDDWQDIFLAWFPNKHLNITGAWVNLGSIATKKDQKGFYLSIQGSY